MKTLRTAAAAFAFAAGLAGAVVFTLAGADVPAKEGDLVPIAFGTRMQIRNDGPADATFLIVMTPNPSEMRPAHSHGVGAIGGAGW